MQCYVIDERIAAGLLTVFHGWERLVCFSDDLPSEDTPYSQARFEFWLLPSERR